jgi:hypothetical protein
MQFAEPQMTEKQKQEFCERFKAKGQEPKAKS